MTTLLRILRLYPLALWAGGEVFFVLVAAIAFSVLPDAPFWPGWWCVVR